MEPDRPAVDRRSPGSAASRGARLVAEPGRLLTSPARGQSIPYFMLPTIGWRDTLPGFADSDSLRCRAHRVGHERPVA